MIIPLPKRTVRRLGCIRLLVLLSALLRAELDVVACKFESRSNLFVFLPTVAQGIDYSESFRLNSTACLEERSILVVVNFSETQPPEKAIKKEIENISVRINKINIHRTMWIWIAINAKVTDTQWRLRRHWPFSDFWEPRKLVGHEMDLKDERLSSPGTRK